MSDRIKADLALAFCTLIWGATFVVVKDALADASIFAFMASRFVLAALLMGIMSWRVLRNLDRATFWAGIQIGFAMFAGYVFQTVGLKFTTPSKAAFITGFSVVLVPVMLGMFGTRRVNSWVWAGALAALGGLYFLTVPAAGFARLNKGDVIAMGCAVMFADPHYSGGQLQPETFRRGAEFSASGRHGDSKFIGDSLFGRNEVGIAAHFLDGKFCVGRADHRDRRDGHRVHFASLGATAHHSIAHRNFAQSRAGVCRFDVFLRFA